MADKKTDNANPAAKLALRGYFLRRYHAHHRPLVFDCCQATGLLWGALRREFDVDYWGVDLKPAPGRLKIDSIRILQNPDFHADIIDVDTYGPPWKHWIEILPRIKGPTTVFLTIGAGMAGLSRIGFTAIREVGIPFKIPTAFEQKISALSVSYMLALPLKHDIIIQECREAPRGPNARYFGVHLIPRTT